MGKVVKSIFKVVSSIFGGGDEVSKPPPAPAPEPVTPMPTPNDKAVQDAKRKSIAAIKARQGRASTILTSEDGTGGDGGGGGSSGGGSLGV
jgi:uncharacterized membrane protein YgcG